MRSYCTLFDGNYLSRGITMIDSLRNVSADHIVFVLAIDELVSETLKNNSGVIIIKLGDVEEKYPRLEKAKETRSSVEYYWTLTPSLIKYCIETYRLEECTYIDADIYFYNDPEALFLEVKSYSALITEHNYTPKYDQTNTSGKYCVQFLNIKNNSFGIEILDWWQEKCIEWCYNRMENGKFGDQKYLDDWTTRFKSVHVAQDIGCGIAPWNIAKYDIVVKHSLFNVQDKVTKQIGAMIFYHFHGLKKYENNRWFLSGYDITTTVIEKLYKPYIGNIEKNENKYNCQNKAEKLPSDTIKTSIMVKSWLRGVFRGVGILFKSIIKNEFLEAQKMEIKEFNEHIIELQ